jgi:hypothetical protein
MAGRYAIKPVNNGAAHTSVCVCVCVRARARVRVCVHRDTHGLAGVDSAQRRNYCTLHACVCLCSISPATALNPVACTARAMQGNERFLCKRCFLIHNPKAHCFLCYLSLSRASRRLHARRHGTSAASQQLCTHRHAPH